MKGILVVLAVISMALIGLAGAFGIHHDSGAHNFTLDLTNVSPDVFIEIRGHPGLAPFDGFTYGNPKYPAMETPEENLKHWLDKDIPLTPSI